MSTTSNLVTVVICFGSTVVSHVRIPPFVSQKQKVVFSFGNVSASGGYYIASAADQIFASKSTLVSCISRHIVRETRFDLTMLLDPTSMQ